MEAHKNRCSARHEPLRPAHRGSVPGPCPVSGPPLCCWCFCRIFLIDCASSSVVDFSCPWRNNAGILPAVARIERTMTVVFSPDRRTTVTEPFSDIENDPVRAREEQSPSLPRHCIKTHNDHVPARFFPRLDAAHHTVTDNGKRRIDRERPFIGGKRSFPGIRSFRYNIGRRSLDLEHDPGKRSIGKIPDALHRQSLFRAECGGGQRLKPDKRREKTLS